MTKTKQHSSPPPRRPTRRHHERKKPAGPSNDQRKHHNKEVPTTTTAEERDVHNNNHEDDRQRCDGRESNDKSGAGNNNNMAITSTTRRANAILRTRRQRQHHLTTTTAATTTNDKVPQSKQKVATTNNNKRRHHHHKRQQQQQHCQNDNKTHLKSSRRPQHRRVHTSVEKKQVNNCNKGGTNATNNDKSEHKRRGGMNVDDSTGVNIVEIDDNENRVRHGRRRHTKHRQQQLQRGNDDDIHVKTDLNDIQQRGVDGEADDLTHKRDEKDLAQGFIMQTISSTTTTVIRRKEQDLKTQRRHGIKVRTFSSCNEDEGCENVEIALNYEEMAPDYLYQYQFLNGLTDNDDDGRDEKNKEWSKSKDTLKMEVNALGNNGWHRNLKLLLHSATDSAPLSSSVDKSFTDATVGALTASNKLENLQHAPILSEEDALRAEYEMLQREIESLERDRLALENQFYKVEAEKGNHGALTSFQQFRQKLRYINNEDIMSIPSMLWMEEVQLDPPQLKSSHNRRHRHEKVSKRSKTYENSDCNNIVSKIESKFQKSVREHRGMGLALLIADAECRNAVSRHCYKRGGAKRNKKSNDVMNDPIRNSILQVEGAATMIYGGGEYLRCCGITGSETYANGGDQHCTSEKQWGTSCFLKFDDGKMCHHGSLPSNLVNRLARENRKMESIRYLSTGPLLPDSSNVSDMGEGRCYYLEFDDGECWWNVAASNDEYDVVLERIFSEVDVHRVAFGRSSSDNIISSSSWIVIGKDGSVHYRNIPQGLHDLLSARDGEELRVAPCEVSLGISGSYFVRFLDGSVDYNLPKFAADFFEELELQGLLIRNVSLHVDTADCLIRFQKRRK